MFSKFQVFRFSSFAKYFLFLSLGHPTPRLFKQGEQLPLLVGSGSSRRGQCIPSNKVKTPSRKERAAPQSPQLQRHLRPSLLLNSQTTWPSHTGQPQNNLPKTSWLSPKVTCWRLSTNWPSHSSLLDRKTNFCLVMEKSCLALKYDILDPTPCI